MSPHFKQKLNEDFLIFSGEWHDGLPCPTKEGEPGGGKAVDLCVLVCIFFFFYISNTPIFDEIFILIQ